MAAGTLPKPGTRYGPCAASCTHIDCAKTRVMANSMCGICGLRVGYEVRFYINNDPAIGTELVHAYCWEEMPEGRTATVASQVGGIGRGELK
jgi:hypothetical protein